MTAVEDLIKKEDLEATYEAVFDFIKKSESDPHGAAAEFERARVSLFPDEQPEQPEPQSWDEAVQQLKQSVGKGSVTPEQAARLVSQKPVLTEESYKRIKYAEHEYSQQPGIAYVGKEKLNYRPYFGELSLGTDVANFDNLRKSLTEDVGRAFNGWGRIRRIDVVGEQLIVNNVLYAPTLSPDILSLLPLDARSYVQGGCFASLFDWSALRSMTGIYSLSFDDASFFVTVVSSDLGLGRRAGISSLFRICRSLDIITICGESVSRDELYTPKSYDAKMRVGKARLYADKTDFFYMSCHSKESLKDICMDSIRRVMHSRSSKFIKFLGIGAIGAAGLVLGTAITAKNVLPYAGRLLVNMFKDGMRPVEKEC